MPRRYTVGPYLEFHVHGPVGIETGALYKRFGFDTVSTSSGFPYGPTAERYVPTVDYKTDWPIEMDRRTSVGAAFGGGFEFKIGTLRLDPGIQDLNTV